MAEEKVALDIVIMAAGQGSRMRSKLPKVLHKLAGKTLLQHVLQSASALPARRVIVITGHGAEAVEASVSAPNLVFVRQAEQLGTGHAVLQAVPMLGNDGRTLILNGDVPLIETETAQNLVAACGDERLALLTVELDEPRGYGRIVRGARSANRQVARGEDPPAIEGRGEIARIVEEKDATDTERSIREIYTGAMAAPNAALKRWLAALRDDNAQGEYYLTDVVAAAANDGIPIIGVSAKSRVEVLGVNDARQLAELERSLQRRYADAFLTAGVRLADPNRFDVRGDLRCGSDVEIDIDCVFEGEVTLGDGVSIGAHCVIRNARIDAGAKIKPFTHIDGEALGVHVGSGAVVGPFARLRAGAELGEQVHIGNFVEIKKARLGTGAKANHLAYIGDAQVGARVNFGAGSITANYDGVAKHQTTIGDDAQVGSNCVLVAPITVGDGATIGAGSTISKDAPPRQLTVARARQTTLAGWKRPTKD